jgi:hypothetical protein
MVPENDDFVRYGAVDDADDIPHGCRDVLLVVEEVER